VIAPPLVVQVSPEADSVRGHRAAVVPLVNVNTLAPTERNLVRPVQLVCTSEATAKIAYIAAAVLTIVKTVKYLQYAVTVLQDNMHKQ